MKLRTNSKINLKLILSAYLFMLTGLPVQTAFSSPAGPSSSSPLGTSTAPTPATPATPSSTLPTAASTTPGKPASPVLQPNLPSKTSTPSPEASDMNTVVVTGSYLPTTASQVGADPISYVTNDQINEGGTEDILQTLQKFDTSFTGAGNLGRGNANVASANTLGGSFIQIHNLPTLTLVDGQRIGNAPGSITGGNTGVDVNLIPIAAIDHIEVLKDGASSAYGSDAIGGVVNILLKQHYNGAEIDGHYGFTTKSDVSEYRGSAIGGVSDGTTDVFAGIEYYQIDPLYSRDRDISAPEGNIRFGGTNDGLSPSSPGKILNAGTTGDAFQLISGTPGAAGYPTGAAVGAPVDPGSLPNAYALSPYHTYELSQNTTQTIGQTRYNAFTTFHRDLYGKQMQLFGDFMYTKNQSTTILNPSPSNTTAGVFISATNPTNPFGANFDGTGANIGAGDNPYGLIAFNRGVDFGNRVFTTDDDFYRVSTGIKGDIIPEFSYSLNFNYNNNLIEYDTQNLIVGSKLNQAIAGTLRDSGGNLLPAYNYFATPGQNSQATIDNIRGTSSEYLTSTFYNVNPVLTSTPVDLPAGPLGIALGGEYRIETLQFEDDTLTQDASFLDGVPISPTHGKRTTGAVFSEINIPIFGPGFNAPGIYSLNVDAGGRVESFSDVGHSGVPKIAMTYQPYDDSLTIRGSYSQGFQAPTLYQLNGPVSSGFSNEVAITPTGGGAAVVNQANQTQYTNPNLKPSTSESWTAGIVYSPKFAKGLTVHWDYYRTRIKNFVILGPSVPVALQSVENNGAASPYASQVAIGAAPGQPGSTAITAPGQVSTALNNGDLFVNQTEQNAATEDIDGFDTGYTYELPLKDYGKLTFASDADFYFDYRVSAAPGLPEVNYIGTYTNLDAAYQGTIPNFRFNTSIRYDYGGFSAFAIMNFIPGVSDEGTQFQAINAPTNSETANGQPYKVNSFTTFDTSISYEFGKDKFDTDSKDRPFPLSWKTWYDGIGLTAGVQNVGDTKAPVDPSEATNDNTDLATYDTTGRFIFFDISKKF